LEEYKILFDGTLGEFNMDPVNIELKDENVAPVSHNPFGIPKSLEETMKREVDYFVKIGVLEETSNSEWNFQVMELESKRGNQMTVMNVVGVFFAKQDIFKDKKVTKALGQLSTLALEERKK